MSAIKPNTLSMLISTLRDLNRRMFAIYSLDVDQRAVFNSVIAPEDIPILERGYEIGLQSASHSHAIKLAVPVKYEMNNGYCEHNTVYIDVGLKQVRCLLPKYATNKAFTIDPSMPFYECVKDYADKMYPIAVMFARARIALEILSDACTNMRQVRYFMPSIITLLKEAGLDDDAKNLSKNTIPRTIPSLPHGSRQIIIDTNTIIAKATMVPTQAHAPVHYGVRFEDHHKVETGQQSQLLTW